MGQSRSNHNLGVAFGLYLVVLAVSFFLVDRLDALTSGFSSPDEPSHFVNSLFVWDYLAHHFPAHPLAQAREFYLSFPKLSIGHWPPLYYLTTGALFFVMPRASEAVMILNVIVCAAPALLCAYVVLQFASWRWALFAALAYVLLPTTVDNSMYFMLDQPVALLSLAAAIVWWKYSRNPGYALAMAFAMLAAAAMLVKGTGWLVVLFPIFHIVLGRNYHLLTHPATYMAALVAATPVAPWYLRTADVSADGFLQTPGFEYALTSLGLNLKVLGGNAGIIGIAGVVEAVLLVAVRRGVGWIHRDVFVLCTSLIAATLTLLAIVPAAIEPRYMAPALPAVVILAIMGLKLASTLPILARRPRARAAVLVAAIVLFLVPAGWSVHTRPRKGDLRMDVAADIATALEHQVIVVDGKVGGEGAFIAELAMRREQGSVYAVRASRLLSSSSWSHQHYRLLLQTPAAVKGALIDLGASVIVLERRPEVDYSAHSRLLEDALQLPDSPYRLAQALEHRNQAGTTYVYVAEGTMHGNLARVREVSFPKKSRQF